MSRPLLTVGSTGADVVVLQRALRIDADGVFGVGTRAAVIAAQRRHGLTPDGVVGPATWVALGIGDAPAIVVPPLVSASNGRVVQRAVTPAGGWTSAEQAPARVLMEGAGPWGWSPLIGVGFLGFPTAGDGQGMELLQISCGHTHRGTFRTKDHQAIDLAIRSGSALVTAPDDGVLLLADEVDVAAVAAGDARRFNGGAGRYLICAFTLPDGRVALVRFLHFLDVPNRYTGGGERFTAQPIRRGDVLGVVGGDASKDLGAGWSLGDGHLHFDVKVVAAHLVDLSKGYDGIATAWARAEYFDVLPMVRPAFDLHFRLAFAAGWDR